MEARGRSARRGIMADPGSYFTDPNEKLLATAVWEIAGKPSNDPAWKRLHPVHTAYANLPHMTRRVILARDWITNAREQLDWQTGKNDGGVRFVNEFFEDRFKRQTDFTAKQIANVEHFYVSAMYSDLTGPLVGIPVAMTAIWEFGVGPLRIHYREHQRENEGKPYRSWVVLENIKENIRQFRGADRKGFEFGLSSGAKSQLTVELDKVVNYSLDNPLGDPLTISPMTYTLYRSRKTKKGDTLSLLAKWAYKDPQNWPIIWLQNRDKGKLGSNYNVLAPDTWLDIPFLSSVSPAQLAEAKTIAANWRPGLDWR